MLLQNDSGECAGIPRLQSWNRALADGASDFLAVVDNVDDKRVRLEQCVGALYDRVAGFEEFQTLLAAANRSRPPTDQPWGWHPILESEGTRIGLLVVHRFGRIPLHDHPEAYGAQRVLVGRVGIRQFDEQRTRGPSGALRSLKLVAERVLNEGETASFAPDSGNIHGFETAWPRAVLLSATARHRPHEQRSWYYPLPLRSPENASLLVNRIHRRPSPAPGGAC